VVQHNNLLSIVLFTPKLFVAEKLNRLPAKRSCSWLACWQIDWSKRKRNQQQHDDLSAEIIWS
jgi:hypothetical protein